MGLRLVSGLLLLVAGCGSVDHTKLKEEVHTSTQADYVVRESNSKYRAGWIEDANEWARQNMPDVQEFRYFSYETEPKVSREVACSLARSFATSQIATEIKSFIQLTVASSVEGKAALDSDSFQSSPLRDYIEESLVHKVSTAIHGTQISKLYWEKRNYQRVLGAKADQTGFVCAALIKIPRSILERAVQQAAQRVVAQAENPNQKSLLQKALAEADANFNKTAEPTATQVNKTVEPVVTQN
jgi:hypothetical protein